MAAKKCTIKGLVLRRGDDGHWLEFVASTGRRAAINLESHFLEDRIVHRAIREWAQEQEVEVS